MTKMEYFDMLVQLLFEKLCEHGEAGLLAHLDKERTEKKLINGDVQYISAQRHLMDDNMFVLNPRQEKVAIACDDCGQVHIMEVFSRDYDRSWMVTFRRDDELTKTWRKIKEK